MQFYRKHHKSIIVAIMACLFLALAIILFYWHVVSGSRPGFQAFEPSILPNGVHITSKQLRYWPDEATSELTISLSDAVFSISESKFIPDANRASATRCTGVPNTSCLTLTTPRRQSYQVNTTNFSNGSKTQLIIIDKGTTRIELSFGGGRTIDTYTKTNWNNVIDSFHPISLSGVRIERDAVAK